MTLESEIINESNFAFQMVSMVPRLSNLKKIDILVKAYELI